MAQQETRRGKALDRAQKFLAYEDDSAVTEGEREAFSRQAEKLIKKWNFTDEELFPPDPEPESERAPWAPSHDWTNGPPQTSGPKWIPPKNSNGVVKGEEALEFAASLLEDIFK